MAIHHTSPGGRTAPMPTGIACGVGFAGAILATIIAVALHSSHQPLFALLPLGAVTAIVAALTSWVGALAAGWICWLLDSGFVIGREAQLTFGPPAQVAALILVVVAVSTAAIAHVHRSRRN